MEKSSEVYVYGSGGHGKVVATVLDSQNLHPRGFIDDDPRAVGKKVLGLPVVGGFDHLRTLQKQNRSTAVIVGIGNNQVRKNLFDRIIQGEIAVISAIHSACSIHDSIRFGIGTVAMAGVIINVDARIGRNVILNTGVSIDHDCVIGDHVHLGPGVILAGNVVVGEEAFLGLGVCVIPGVRIGARAVVGAGAVVLENVPDGSTVAGVPAKSIARSQTQWDAGTLT